MPKTGVPRKSRTTPPVNYSPMFPGGNQGLRPDNAKARVAIGDNGIREVIQKDIAGTIRRDNKVR